MQRAKGARKIDKSTADQSPTRAAEDVTSACDELAHLLELVAKGKLDVSAEELREVQRHAVLAARDLTQVAAKLFALIRARDTDEALAKLGHGVES